VTDIIIIVIFFLFFAWVVGRFLVLLLISLIQQVFEENPTDKEKPKRS